MRRDRVDVSAAWRVQKSLLYGDAAHEVVRGAYRGDTRKRKEEFVDAQGGAAPCRTARAVW